jgi:tagaturonate reductase
MTLSRQTIATLPADSGWSVPSENVFQLPEKVLQFGTGVLLRGLPDYFINKANNAGVFNGRVVIVKSTTSGGTNEFAEQDGLFTHCIRGIEGGNKVEENIINASISRVLTAKDQWEEILRCAANPEMEIVISNTTEVGIALVKDDKVSSNPPVSFPGKLLAFLYERYKFFKGDSGKGMVIIPAELIVDNGKKLESIVMELAKLKGLETEFIEWLQNSNHFCSSLVDRIVPGKLPAEEKEKVESDFGFTDNLMILSESYSLWAIEAKSDIIKNKLSFAEVNEGVVISPDINKFRELKLRLLNGTHTFSCGLAYLAGFRTVKSAMENSKMSAFIKDLMLTEMAPAIVTSELTIHEATVFATSVLDRFSNPYLDHKWLSISVQFSSKMKMRNVPVLLQHYNKTTAVPLHMSLGFAAYILFMKCEAADRKFIGQP